MIAVQIARILAHFILFLDTTDDDTVDPDAAVEMMEVLAVQLQSLDKDFLRELIDGFAIVADEIGGEDGRSVRYIPLDFDLEDELAENDSVRLAELEALRDARHREWMAENYERVLSKS